MDALVTLRILMRWAHICAAVSWIGGGAFYWLVLGPTLKEIKEPSWAISLAAGVRQRFRALTAISMGILVATGLFETFDRLTEGNLGTGYLAVLGVKLALVAAMYLVANKLSEEKAGEAEGFDELETGRSITPSASSLRSVIVSPEVMILLGGAILLAAAILNIFYQTSLAGL
ncbi:MAG: hypothetical protein M1358_02280 [Chloroflexi bacterium]|nr:hypothetical protein [Chloroflexota bacterium]